MAGNFRTPPTGYNGFGPNDDVSSHAHSTQDLPIGRGINKVVGTDDLADTDDSDPPVRAISGARMTGYYNVRSRLNADNVQDAIDELAGVHPRGGAGFRVTAQEDTSGGLPDNTAAERYVVVTTPGSGANLGDLLYDNGQNDGQPMEIVPGASGRLISTTASFTGGAIELPIAWLPYVWDSTANNWIADLNTFLAPNEFYVDTSRIPVSNEDRWVDTILEALTRAVVMFGDNAPIVIRLREDQSHTFSGNFPIELDAITFIADGMRTLGNGPTGVETGVLAFQAGATLPSVAGKIAYVNFKGLRITGPLDVEDNWNLSFLDCYLADSSITLSTPDSGTAPTVDLQGCTLEDSGVSRHPCTFITNCSSGSSLFTLTDCVCTIAVNDARGPWFQLNGGNAVFVNCSMNLNNTATAPTDAIFAANAGGDAPIGIRLCSFTGCNLSVSGTTGNYIFGQVDANFVALTALNTAIYFVNALAFGVYLSNLATQFRIITSTSAIVPGGTLPVGSTIEPAYPAGVGSFAPGAMTSTPFGELFPGYKQYLNAAPAFGVTTAMAPVIASNLFEAVSANGLVYYEAKITGKGPANSADAYVAVIRGAAKRNGAGALTKVGVEDKTEIVATLDAGNANADVSVTGDDIGIDVTAPGLAGTSWFAELQVLSVA